MQYLGACTHASGVHIFKQNRSIFGDRMHFGALNFLRIINSSNETSRYFVSLNIQHTHLEYTAESFFPNLTRIIPALNSITSAIFIRDNGALCLPKEAQNKLMDMVNGQGYIQPCSCYTRINKPRTIIEDIIGGEDCRILFGSISFVGNSTMTEKMRKQLENVEILRGYIEIINTTFTSLDFIKNLKKVFYPPEFEKENLKPEIIRISENPNLKSLGFFLDVVQDEWKMTARENPVIVVENNPQLRFAPAERPYYSFIMAEMDFTSKEKPITLDQSSCQLVEPISKNIDSIKGCQSVAGNLTIDSSFDDYSLEQMDEIFGNLYCLHGCLTIRGTKLTNLTFLHDLQLVNCTVQRPAVVIEDNPELKWLDVQIHGFEGSVSPVTIKIKNNAKLCPHEVDYLKRIMNSPWRLIEFDRWDHQCQDARQHSSDWLPYYYAIGVGILVVGMFALEGVVQLVENRRQKRTKWPEMTE